MMQFNAYSIIFIVIFLLHNGLETILAVLQIRHLKNRKSNVPRHLKGHVSLEEIQKAVAYQLEKLRFGLFVRFLEMIPLWVMILVGFAAYDEWCRNWELNELLTGLLFIGGISLAGTILGLPASLYFTFSIEQRHGFNKQTLSGFFVDQIKDLLVGAILGGALLSAVLYVMQSTTYWWILAFGVVLLFQLLMMWMYPLVIMPLFNRFEPVPTELSNAVAALATEVGFPLQGVVSMDGSRRSAHSNAFVIGFTGARRIVLYDTLMAKLETPALVAVLAHELGHFKLGHVKKRIAAAAVLGFGVFAAFYWLSLQPGVYAGLGFPMMSAYAALVSFGLMVSEMSFPLGFISRLLSRRDEYAADRFAVNAVKNGVDLHRALIALTKQNRSSPGSHKWYRQYYNSHPSLRERLNAIERECVHKGFPTLSSEAVAKPTGEEN